MTVENNKSVFTLLRLIGKKPNHSVDYFYIQDNERLSIIDLKKMPKLLASIKALEKSSRSYLYIDLFNSNSVRYIGFDQEKDSAEIINEVEGELSFASVESDVKNFLEINLNDLSALPQPWTTVMDDVQLPDKKTSSTNLMGVNTYPPRTPSQDIQSRYQNHNHNYNRDSYGSNAYKERETFVDKLYLLIKNGNTSLAVDYIEEYMAEKTASDKTEDVEIVSSILRWVTLEKLDYFSLRQLIHSTSDKYQHRQELLGKFRDAFNNTKPYRIQDGYLAKTGS